MSETAATESPETWEQRAVRNAREAQAIVTRSEVLESIRDLDAIFRSADVK